MSSPGARFLPTWSRSSRTAAGLGLAALALFGAARLHALWNRARGEDPSALFPRRLAEVRERALGLQAQLLGAADRAASLPETPAALAGDRTALARLFRALEAISGREEDPAVAVHSLPFSTVAWSGRATDLGGVAAAARLEKGLFVLGGSVTTTLVATSAVRGPAGEALGFATAELPLRVQRNIRNEYLQDFDRLAGPAPGIEVRYRDARAESPEPFPPLPGGTPSLEDRIVGPDGRLLAVLRITAPSPVERGSALDLAYRRGVCALVGAALLVWMLAPAPVRPGRLARMALGATALRVAFLVLGAPVAQRASGLLSPDAYGSTLLGPLLRSPLDMLLTALAASAVAGWLLERALARAPRAPSAARALTAGLLALPVPIAVSAVIADTFANSPLDLETVTLVPRSTAHLVLQLSLLLVVAAGLALLVALLSLAGPWTRTQAGRLRLLAPWLLVGLLAWRFWPRLHLGLPPLSAVFLFLAAAALGASSPAWLPRLKTASAGARAGCALGAVALLSLLLYPSLRYFAEKETRQQIELDHASMILRQPQWRAYVLDQAQRKIDAVELLEETPPGPAVPGLEELAFSVWSATELATFGFSSAVEIQDRSGVVISRFALNLPPLTVSGAPQPLPPDEGWRVSRERLSLASAELGVLHARRRLTYHAEPHGAVHLYVGEDFLNLPFIAARDPYSVLYRTAGAASGRDQAASLVVYDASGTVLFSSADRPPALTRDLVRRLGGKGGRLWTTLLVDGRLHHVFLFSDGATTYALGYPRVGAGRFAADLVEAVASLTLVAFGALAALVLVRSALRRPSLSLASLREGVRRRFALRVFVAFVVVALVPAVVLEAVVRRFVAARLQRESEDQALERAAVARKAVEDFAFFQRREAPGHEPVTDAALVWVASLIRNDLDVFSRGRIFASSKRELYASGLLPPRISGVVFRALVLDQVPSVLRKERIGGFSTLMVSVPVKLAGTEPGILSIPLALRQREVQATLDDLDRAIRLASVAFLVLAAGLAHSLAGRISGPIRDLTRATRRIAEGDLDARVSTTARDELKELVESFNQMAGDLDRQRRDLERSNRLAAWAEMARQVAHEVKNPLTPIQLSAEHLRRVFRDRSTDFGATLNACTDTILRQVESLRRIVTEFSAFARPPGSDLTHLDLSEVVSEAIAPYATGLPPGVRISLIAPRGLPRARLDRRLAERAVVNLVENALQAVGERGEITVRLTGGNGRVMVEVEDSGPGIEPEIRDKVFEPFFSTKTGGSGLGLALVKKIAEDHGGGASLESAPGERTRARLWFPTGSEAST